LLRCEISISYREIYSKELDSLNNFHEKDKVKQLSGIKSNIDDMHARGKINDQHYTTAGILPNMLSHDYSES
jgi:hypothetical protein